MFGAIRAELHIVACFAQNAGYASAWLSPTIYGFFSPQLRQAARRTFCGSRCRGSAVGPDTALVGGAGSGGFSSDDDGAAPRQPLSPLQHNAPRYAHLRPEPTSSGAGDSGDNSQRQLQLNQQQHHPQNVPASPQVFTVSVQASSVHSSEQPAAAAEAMVLPPPLVAADKTVMVVA